MMTESTAHTRKRQFRLKRLPIDDRTMSATEHARRVLQGCCDSEVRQWRDSQQDNLTVLEARVRVALGYLGGAQ